MLQDIIFRMSLTSDQTVLDLGCGTGNITCQIAHAVASVTAIDNNRAMLDIAQDKTREIGSGNTTFLDLDISAGDHMQIQPQVIVLCNVLYAIPNPEVLLQNLFKQLPVGGRLVIATPKQKFQLGEVLRFQNPLTGKPPGFWLNIQNDEARIRDCVSQAYVGEPEAVQNQVFELTSINRQIVGNPDFNFFTRNELQALLSTCAWTQMMYETTYAGQNWLITLIK